jgi:murein L,D-transpeptidase YafK
MGYPNAYDRSKGYTGDYLMIHGSCVSIGCYAMTDAGIEEIYTLAYKAVEGGQSFFRVHAFPFRMTEEAMANNADHAWLNFWQNLKQGYDWFQKHKTPPNVTVLNGEYVFN